jgi:hypothetical protein
MDDWCIVEGGEATFEAPRDREVLYPSKLEPVQVLSVHQGKGEKRGGSKCGGAAGHVVLLTLYGNDAHEGGADGDSADDDSVYSAGSTHKGVGLSQFMDSDDCTGGAGSSDESPVESPVGLSAFMEGDTILTEAASGQSSPAGLGKFMEEQTTQETQPAEGGLGRYMETADSDSESAVSKTCNCEGACTCGGSDDGCVFALE